jgi:hypothetical protein
MFNTGDKVRIRDGSRGVWNQWMGENCAEGDYKAETFTISGYHPKLDNYYSLEEVKQTASVDGYFLDSWFERVFEPVKIPKPKKSKVVLVKEPDKFNTVVKGMDQIPLGRIAKKDHGLYFARTGINEVIKIWTGENKGIGGPTIESANREEDTWKNAQFELLPLDTTITLCFNGKWEGSNGNN